MVCSSTSAGLSCVTKTDAQCGQSCHCYHCLFCALHLGGEEGDDRFGGICQSILTDLKRSWPDLQTAIAVFSELRPVLLSLPMNMAQILQEILSAKRIGTFLRNCDVDYLEGTSSSFASAHLGDEATPDSEQDRDLYIIGTVGWDIDQPQQVSTSSDGHSVVNTPAIKFRLHDLNVHFPRGEITLVAGKFGSGKTLLLLALLGEAKLLSGKINYAVSPIMNPLTAASVEVRSLAKRGVAYVPQVKSSDLAEIIFDI